MTPEDLGIPDFTATSGNICRSKFMVGANVPCEGGSEIRVAFYCSWKHKPTLEDRKEFEAYCVTKFPGRVDVSGTRGDRNETLEQALRQALYFARTGKMSSPEMN